MLRLQAQGLQLQMLRLQAQGLQPQLQLQLQASAVMGAAVYPGATTPIGSRAHRVRDRWGPLDKKGVGVDWTGMLKGGAGGARGAFLLFELHLKIFSEKFANRRVRSPKVDRVRFVGGATGYSHMMSGC